MGLFSTGEPALDQAAHFGFGFETWTYPWISVLFIIYQQTQTDRSGNSVDYSVYFAGWASAIAYHGYLDKKLTLSK